jgi:RNA polymerase sigma factor (sigma-70 family)
VALLENHDIHRIYVDNQRSSNGRWMESLYFKLRPLVISRIKNFKSFCHVEDLEQEFNLALWTAIKTFDCHRHFDFYRWSNWHFAKASRDFQKKYEDNTSINLDGIDVKRQDQVVLVQEILSCKTLTEREREIINLAFFQDQTLESIGNRLNLSAERIRVLKNRAIIKLKDYVEE